jgi:hypothetical protein
VNKVEQILAEVQYSHLTAAPITTVNKTIKVITVMRTITCYVRNRNFVTFHLDVVIYLGVKCVGRFRGCQSVLVRIRWLLQDSSIIAFTFFLTET